ncbi:hypothetical protein FUT82_08690 [Treponema phagedenis]|uniref:Uncharacterized protein n=1 Tax=Treponema phagedenis TaxID=162 RepID=A0AAE6IUA4_TREPH|nr:hypothetical protein FUT82_08690 [Treponema phagedenis]
MVLNSSDVLKQNYLQSFKTRRFGFDKDVKTKPLCLTLFFIKIFMIFVRFIKEYDRAIKKTLYQLNLIIQAF